jgi:uncharacterized membrane protein SpoIIM required for sporulation
MFSSHAAILELAQDFAEELGRYQRLGSRRDGSFFSHSFALIEKYEILTSQVYNLRSALSEQDPFRRQIEERLFDFGQALNVIRAEEKSEASFSIRYRKAWRDHLSLFLFTAVFFVITIAIGWQLATTDPAAVSLIVPQKAIEEILDRSRWFDSLQKNAFLGGAQIALNNIKVSIYCCALGALVGLGGLVILAFNGLFFGGMLGFCYVNQFHQELLGFVIGHGPLELSIIVSAAFSGFIIGRVFFMHPYNLFFTRMRLAATDAGTILTGIVPWLVLAAIIEAGISPWPMLSDTVKISVSLRQVRVIS